MNRFKVCLYCESVQACVSRDQCTQKDLIKPSVPLHPRSDPIAPASYDVKRIIRGVQINLDEVDVLVLRTPTGGIRNELTEASLHLRMAIDKLTGLA